MDRPVRGMETVVATVSGYHGLERFNLIKLISQSGANYVGAMSKSITHLVCWKFEGKKYDIAKKLRIAIVNHRWVEDCIREGKRVPEDLYTMQCGEELGPLSLQVPTTNKAEFLHNNRTALSDKSNTFEGSERLVNGVDCGDSGLPSWTDSILLNENLFPELNKTNNSASKSKTKRIKKSLGQVDRSNGRFCSKDPPLYGLIGLENEDTSSKSTIQPVKGKGKISGNEDSRFEDMKSQLVKGKRKISEDTSTSLAECPSNGQRALKKDVRKNSFWIDISDSDEECSPIRFGSKNSEVASSSKYEDDEENVNVLETAITSDAASKGAGPSMNEAFDGIEDIIDWNHPRILRDTNSEPEEALIPTDVPNSCPAGQNKDANQFEPNSKSEEDVSCIICWTEFCSTRGVLPCKHRFCYSCIQKWANQLVASRKNPACPLCKASFARITKMEHATTSEQKIYSQTIPCASATDVFFLNDQERIGFGLESSVAAVCSECSCREPEELLINCQSCQYRCIHKYCLDPPLFPWTCVHCKDLQRIYHNARSIA